MTREESARPRTKLGFRQQLTAYVIAEAESHEAAARMFDQHP